MTTTYCNKHKAAKRVRGGCSAHPDNWYCPECEATTPQEVIDALVQQYGGGSFEDVISNMQKRITKLESALSISEMARRSWEQHAEGNKMCNMCNYLERDVCCERFEVLEKKLTEANEVIQAIKELDDLSTSLGED